jgi:hypothetical protein
MKRSFVVSIVLAIYILSGCSTLFAPQQLSENYSRLAGVECNAPEAVDGDINTISSNTRIIISLPEKKSIRKIVIHNLNISNFILYESIGEEGEWKIIESVKGNRQARVVIDAHVITDKIRMFITDTSGTRFADAGSLRDVDGNTNLFSSQVDAPPQIQEIELYGLVDKVDKIEPRGPLF